MITLFALVVLSGLALSLSYRAGVERRLARDDVVMAQLKAQAESVAAIAMSRLAHSHDSFTHESQAWHNHGPLASERWLSSWQSDETNQEPEYVVDYEVIDEEGKLHTSFASAEALLLLGMSHDQAASLADWMDEDDDSQSGGAESDYYRQHQPPHECKNAPLNSLSELLMIRGFSRTDYYGSVSLDGQVRAGWIRWLTCVGDGRLNLNTAPLEVLKTLPLEAGAAEQIAAYRTFYPDSGGKLEDHVFRSAEDIHQLQGLTRADADLLAALAKFKSSHFRILIAVSHQRSRLQHHLDILVRVNDNSLEVLEWTVRR